MRKLFWITTAILAAALAIFAASNRAPVALGFWPLPFVADTPLYLVIFASFLCGLVVAALYGTIGRGRLRRELRRREREIDGLKREIAARDPQRAADTVPRPPAPLDR